MCVRLLSIVALILVTLSSGWGLDSRRKNAAPPPEAFVEPDSISIAVLQARPDDAGFQSLFRTAWQALKAKTAQGNSPFLELVISMLGSKDDALLSFLPIQMVRVDRLDKDDQPAATIGVTVAGWPGMQSIYFNSQTNGPDGKPFPTKLVGTTTVYLQKKPNEDVKNAKALARVNGSFARFPNFGVAQRIIPRILGTNVTMPEGDLRDVLTTVDRNKDTYGVLLNRKGSMMKFLIWLNQRDTTRVIAEVGPQRMDNLMPHVQFLTWQGDLISDDQMDLTVRWQTDSEQAAEELADVLKDSRSILRKYGRAADLQMATVGRDVHMDISMVGYRKLLMDYLASSAPTQTPPPPPPAPPSPAEAQPKAAVTPTP